MSVLTHRFNLSDANPNHRPITYVDVINPQTLQRVPNVRALWDTGSTCSVVVSRIINELGLVHHRIVENQYLGGNGNNPIYNTKFSLGNNFEINEVIEVMAVGYIDDTCEVMIGMDIIGLGDFSVCGKNGNICMSFRYPSLHTIDYQRDPGLIISPHI